MALQPATMAATARAAQPRDDAEESFAQPAAEARLSGWRALVGIAVVLAVVALVAAPPLASVVLSVNAGVAGRLVAWVLNLPMFGAPMILARGVVVLIAVLAVSRSHGRP